MSSQSHGKNNDSAELKIKPDSLPKDRFDVANLIIPFAYLPPNTKKGFVIKNKENKQELIRILKRELQKVYEDM